MTAQNKTGPALNGKEQAIVSIASLTAVGDMGNLKTALNAGLNAELTVNEIKEVLVHLYAYCGFPRSLNGITLFMSVLEERKSKGITDTQGKDFIGHADTDNYERGRKTLETLSKTPQVKPAPGFGEFAPRIDAFLKEHLFADIFESDVLSYQQRELVTISALAAMTGVASQLQFHVQAGINTGITKDQLTAVSLIIKEGINEEQANILRNAIKKIH
nr:carboxymuconolactone decarboxylase family protein [uncultured Mucilaginibacter sp.]